MAKIKTPTNIEESIIKDFGNVLDNAAFLKERRNKIVPISPNLDVALGGGVPEGSFVVVAGKPALGKSALSLQIAANAQQVDSDFGPRHIYYFDIEGRLKPRDLTGQSKLDCSADKFTIICSKEGSILTGDQFLDIGEKLISNKRGAVFIFDSFSAICTASRMEAKMGDRIRDDAPLLLSNFCKRINQIIPVNKSIVIGINHIIANTGNGHRTWQEASGHKVQYQADVKLIGQYFKAWTQGSEDEQIGNEIHWTIEKTALDAPPSECVSWFRFGYGYDEYKEIVDLAIGCGVIQRSGAWCSLVDSDKYGDVKVQGIDNLVNLLRDKTDLFIDIKNDVMGRYLES